MHATQRAIRTRFRFGSSRRAGLTSPHTLTRGLIMQKASGHPAYAGLPQLVGTPFQVLFHSPSGVLFTFPSRYWFTIGHQRVFSLGGWAPRIRTRFHVSRSTWDPSEPVSDFAYEPLTLYGRPSQTVPLSVPVPLQRSRNPGVHAHRFRLFRVRSPLLAESRLFSFPRGTEMFHFPRCRPKGL